MSKYIKLDDAEKLLTNALRIAQGFDEPLERSLADLPTIEVCEDCISREWILEEFQKGIGIISKSEHFDELKWLVTHAPSVVPSRAEGEWIESEIPNELYVCSECGGACWSYDWDRTIVKSRYCPDCGAKMKV